MRKILVIGSGGAGKTTVARQIARRTGLPLVHLDQLYWRPGWIPTPNEEWDRIIDELIRLDAWVMDGNYGRTLPQRLAAADAVVFLDLPRRVCTWRVLKRQFQHLGQTRPDVAPGCPERLTLDFLWWIWTYRSRRRPSILTQLEQVGASTRVYIFRRDSEVQRFIASLDQEPRNRGLEPPVHPRI